MKRSLIPALLLLACVGAYAAYRSIPGMGPRPSSTIPPEAQRPAIDLPPMSDPRPESLTLDRRIDATQAAETNSESPPKGAQPRISNSFEAKYAGWTKNRLLDARYSLENTMRDLADREIANRRSKGQYHRVTMERAGGIPIPPEVQSIPLSDRWTQTVLNPVEELTPDRRAEDPMPVWWIVLSRTEYPDLFAQRDEVEWLRVHTTDS